MANEIDQKVISQLLDFSRSVETLTETVEKSINSTDNLVGSQDRFGKKIDAFTEVINGPIQKINQSFSKPPSNDILGAFQEGGIAKDKGKYLVGENGPELVDLPKGSAVIPLNIKDLIEGISKIPELSDIAKENNIGVYADSEDPSLLPSEISDVKNRVSLSKLEEKYDLDLKDQESIDRDKQNKELIDQLKSQSDLLKELKSITQKKISDSIEGVKSEKDSILKNYSDDDNKRYNELVVKIIQSIPKESLNSLSVAKANLIAAKKIEEQKKGNPKELIASFETPANNKVPEIEELVNLPIEQKTDLKSAEQVISPSKGEIENVTKSQEKFLSRELGLLRESKPKEYERIKEISENNIKGEPVLKLESNKDEIIQNKNYKDILSGRIPTTEIIRKIDELPLGSLINNKPEFQRDIESLMPKSIIDSIIPDIKSTVVQSPDLLSVTDQTPKNVLNQTNNEEIQPQIKSFINKVSEKIPELNEIVKGDTSSDKLSESEKFISQIIGGNLDKKEPLKKSIISPDIPELIKTAEKIFVDSYKSEGIKEIKEPEIINKKEELSLNKTNPKVDLNQPEVPDDRIGSSEKLAKSASNLINPNILIKKIEDYAKNSESAELAENISAGNKEANESELIKVAENLISPSVELFYKNQKEIESAKGENILGAFRTGGIVDESGKYLVGENGPEVISSPLSATPISANTQDLSKLVSNTEVLPTTQSTIQNDTLSYPPISPIVNNTNLAKNISNLIGGDNATPTISDLSSKDITQQAASPSEVIKSISNIINGTPVATASPVAFPKSTTQKITSPAEVIKSISNIINGTSIASANPLSPENESQPNFISGAIDLNSTGNSISNSENILTESPTFTQPAEISNSLKKINEPIVPEFKQSITPLNGIKPKEVPSVSESLDKFKDGLSDIFKQNQSVNKNTTDQATPQSGETDQGNKPAVMQSGDSTTTKQDDISKNLNESLDDVKSLLARIAMLLEGPLEFSPMDAPFRPDSRKV